MQKLPKPQLLDDVHPKTSGLLDPATQLIDAIMDGITTFSLVCNILQVIVIAHKLHTTAREIRSSATGSTANYNGFHIICRSIEENVASISKSSNDDTLRDMANECKTLVRAHRNCIPSVPLGKKIGYSRAIYMACLAYYKRKEFDESQQRIEKMAQRISESYLKSMLERVHENTDDMKRSLTAIKQNMSTMEKQLHETQFLSTTGLWAPVSTKNSVNILSEWLRKQKDDRIYLKCMRALYYGHIKLREGKIHKAHRDTFRWIFEEDGKHPGEKLKFRDWLRMQEPTGNLFWISGKPGSGKSTLMKFMASSPQLKENLKVWSEGQPVLLVTHYFWRTGSDLQKTLGGLMRSLLYQILDKNLNLVREIFPGKEWASVGSKYEFSMERLKDALETTLGRVGEENLRIFIMIDGLDEFDDRPDQASQSQETENAEKLIDFLTIFEGFSHVKICVSSRPYEEFRVRYGCPDRSLAVHDMTRDDIQSYIEDKLSKNSKFLELSSQDDQYFRIVQEMVHTAEGVFIWVELALRTLLRGIDRCHDSHTLLQRLRDIPPELGELYDTIIASIDGHDRKIAARPFLLAVGDPRTLINHYFQDEAVRHRAELQETFSLGCLQDTLEDMTSAINERCRSLLTVSRSRYDRSSGRMKSMIHDTVQPIHRTLAEHISRPNVREMLMKQAGTIHDEIWYFCEAQIVVLKAAMWMAKGEHIHDRKGPTFAWRTVSSIFREALWLGPEPISKFCDEIHELIRQWISEGKLELKEISYLFFTLDKWWHSYPLSVVPTNSHLYIEYGTFSWDHVLNALRYEGDREHNMLQSTATEILILLLSNRSCIRTAAWFDILEFFLENGAEPNASSQYTPNTPWAIFVMDLLKSQTKLFRNKTILSLTLKALLSRGADLTAICHAHFSVDRVAGLYIQHLPEAMSLGRHV
ncbi:unnamed protein product [Periconia digitata]|uniref:NACHT domain-containing protein n=1 Tax=Periconia digitata TaxID=1303443 RepID=A0A9W4UEM9_9PLEO|nr:unnamed protein product [Periconia digitata]